MRNFSVHPGYKLATVAVILLISVLSASAVFALGLSQFESTDGNLVVDGTGSDWGTPNLPNLVVAPDIPPWSQRRFLQTSQRR